MTVGFYHGITAHGSSLYAMQVYTGLPGFRELVLDYIASPSLQ
jgi:hypothetical protein